MLELCWRNDFYYDLLNQSASIRLAYLNSTSDLNHVRQLMVLKKNLRTIR